MEIIVGTFFIIYLIVVCAKEGLKGMGKESPVLLVEGFEIISIAVLFWALGNMAELNKWYALEIIGILLIVPVMLGVLVLFCHPRFTNVVSPSYEQHRSSRLAKRGREMEGNIDRYWLDTTNKKSSQKYGWLNK